MLSLADHIFRFSRVREQDTAEPTSGQAGLSTPLVFHSVLICIGEYCRWLIVITRIPILHDHMHEPLIFATFHKLVSNQTVY